MRENLISEAYTFAEYICKDSISIRLAVWKVCLNFLFVETHIPGTGNNTDVI